MITLLSRLFIKNYRDYHTPSVRTAYGILCGLVGIFLNILLFAFKLAAGILSGSVAVTADAFNNLSDAGSSVITLIGFKLAAEKPDKEHPFGHGRFEYISGLIVSLVIMLMGLELAKSSFEKILHPEPVDANLLTFIALAVSIAVKLYMSFYNRAVGSKIDSVSMKATAADSRSDVVSTSAVFLVTLFSSFSKLNLDGYCGLVVALFILYTGFNAARDTIGPLLGQPPKEEFVNEIKSIVMSHPEVKGLHDLVVHDYGPGRVMVSLHAEVDEHADFCKTHDVIDNIERYIAEKMGCSAVIHMDPVSVGDEEAEELKRQLTEFTHKTLSREMTLHDFRLVKGPTHTNVIFDIVVPYECRLSDEQIKKALRKALESAKGTRYFAVITLDRSYI